MSQALGDVPFLGRVFIQHLKNTGQHVVVMICRSDPQQRQSFGLRRTLEHFGEALEELERPKAAERRQEGSRAGGQGGKVEDNLSPTSDNGRVGRGPRHHRRSSPQRRTVVPNAVRVIESESECLIHQSSESAIPIHFTISISCPP